MNDFYVLHNFQTNSGANPASYPMGTASELLWGEAVGGVKLTTHLYLVPRSRMVELYLHRENFIFIKRHYIREDSSENLKPCCDSVNWSRVN
jgi:hypothetical protein